MAGKSLLQIPYNNGLGHRLFEKRIKKRAAAQVGMLAKAKAKRRAKAKAR